MTPNENKISYRRSVACRLPVGGKAAVVCSNRRDHAEPLSCIAWLGLIDRKNSRQLTLRQERVEAS
jgi:hypothetical protein